MYIPKFIPEEKSREIHQWLKGNDYRKALTHWNNSSIREQLWIQEDKKLVPETSKFVDEPINVVIPPNIET